MNFGVIKSIALVYLGHWPVFRVLVAMQDDFEYVYIPATNYRFRVNNIVTWNDKELFWHAAQRTVKFDLVQEEVTNPG